MFLPEAEVTVLKHKHFRTECVLNCPRQLDMDYCQSFVWFCVLVGFSLLHPHSCTEANAAVILIDSTG